MARLLTVEVASPQTVLAGLSCSQPTLTVRLTLLLGLFARQSSDYLRKKNNDNICFPRCGAWTRAEVCATSSRNTRVKINPNYGYVAGFLSSTMRTPIGYFKVR